MTDGTEKIPKELKSDLDSRREAVGSGALERNGHVSKISEGNISFNTEIAVYSLTYYNNTAAPPKCKYCDPSTPDNLVECLLEAPFSSKDSYTIPDDGSHEKIPCPTCGKSGRIVCSGCNGNGRVVCENCNGQGRVSEVYSCDRCGHLDSPRENCIECNGSGQIETKTNCYVCNGYGHDQCGTCSGSGVMRCGTCLGERYQHLFESTKYSLSRSVEANNIPRNWSDKHQGIADKIKWNSDQIDLQRNSEYDFQIQTESLSATFYSVEYGSNHHNCAIVDQNLSLGDVIWDPATSYPRTSIGRKLSDMKSRILW